MDKVCYKQGSCTMCGCRTTALQMANKACDKPCYPKMVDSYKWLMLNRGFSYTDDRITWTLTSKKTFKKFT